MDVMMTLMMMMMMMMMSAHGLVAAKIAERIMLYPPCRLSIYGSDDVGFGALGCCKQHPFFLSPPLHHICRVFHATIAQEVCISYLQQYLNYQLSMSATILRQSTARSGLRNLTVSKFARPATIPSFARGKATLPDLPCTSLPIHCN